MASLNIAIIALLTTVLSCDAFQCYDCSSDINPGCGENLNTAISNTKCTGTYCGIGKTTGIGATIFLRGCFDDESLIPSNNCSNLIYNDLPAYGCSCSRDLCNLNFETASSSSGVKQHADAYALLATSAAVVLLAKLQG